MNSELENNTDSKGNGSGAVDAAIASGLKNSLDAENILGFIDILNNYVHETLTHKVANEEVSATLDVDKNKLIELISESIGKDPTRLVQRQIGFFEKQIDLWKKTSFAMAGGVNQTEDKQLGKTDARFSDPAWSDHPAFSFLKQSYLLNCAFIDELVEDLNVKDDKLKEQIKFAVRQFENSLAPSNFAGTNPEVCRATLETKGQNLMTGVTKFLEDLAKSPSGSFAITQTDDAAFKVGGNLANTPGKVIFENEMMQLIQYTPVTAKVYQRPVLVVPAIINKFYIMDLGPEKSFVKWLLEQGFTVFMISWVNPDESMAETTFADYMLQGPVCALDVIEKISGAKNVHTIGYCIGGTLLAATQAYLKSKNDERIASATFLASLVDFSDPGQLGVFASEKILATVEADIKSKGYLDGRRMGLSFNLLRENSLFWSFYVKNYLLGDKPEAMDMLYWNNDGTNFPRASYSYYMRNMYLENRLIRPNGIELDGVGINLSSISTPAYFVSTIKDHIAPWKSVFKGALIRQGKTRFVLSGSGHIAGIINPPSTEKYGYWINDDLPGLPDQWQKTAEQKPGSWWNDWIEWIKPQAGKKVAALDPTIGVFPVIEDAPGSYVMKQC